MRPLLRTRFDRLARPVEVLGVAALAIQNWRLWGRDKALLAAWAAADSIPPLDVWPALPLVSVLVAAWNEAAGIDDHIKSFLALRYPHKELVLCAGGDDDTFERAVCHAGPTVRVLRQMPGEGKQRALARAFQETGGEIIFLTDADCRLADEPFERTLYTVATGSEVAATGGSRPFKEQLTDPFAFTQAATQLYAAMHGPEYAPGILGRNCAARRALLAATAALDAPAPAGTDYVLAHTLVAAGTRIRQVPESRMPTDFPLAARDYLRQQRRWLRSVAVHGRRFGATAEVRAARRTSLVGLVMLLLPLFGPLFSPWLPAAWGLLLSQALLSRLRYLAFAGRVLARPARLRDVAWQPPLLILDFIAWIQPLGGCVRRGDRWSW